MPTAALLCVAATGVFFMTGMVTGVWKYARIRASADAQAPVYVDIAHRTSLMYAFSTLVLLEFVRLSPLPDLVNLLAAGIPILFFAAAIGSYVIHGWLGDTDNQLRRPHRLGTRTLPAPLISGFMIALVIGEIGGFAVLLVAVLARLAATS